MTKPTKSQEQARERIVQAILLLAEAIRLDGGSLPRPSDWLGLVERLARVSSAFSLDQILERTLERRGESLKLRSGTGELLLLVEVEGAVSPSQMLLLDDEVFRERVRQAEQALGD